MKCSYRSRRRGTAAGTCPVRRADAGRSARRVRHPVPAAAMGRRLPLAGCAGRGGRILVVMSLSSVCRSWSPRGMKKAGCTCGAPGHACHARRPPKLSGKSNRSKKTPRWNGAPGILQGWRPGAGGAKRPRCVWHTGRKGPRKPKPIPGPRRRGPAPDEGGHWARRPWWAALRGGVRCWRSCGTCVRCRSQDHGGAMSSMMPSALGLRRVMRAWRMGRLRPVLRVILQSCEASPGRMGARIGGTGGEGKRKSSGITKT